MDANAVDKEGNTSLHIAARAGFVPTLHVLIAAGARVDLPNKEGKKPIDVALDSATKNVIKGA